MNRRETGNMLINKLQYIYTICFKNKGKDACLFVSNGHMILSKLLKLGKPIAYTQHRDNWISS